MKLYDQHIHSNYSFDSTCKMEKYIEEAIDRGLTRLIFTDHIDIDTTSLTFAPIDFDPELQREEKEKLQKKYPQIEILQGVEIGHRKDIEDKIEKFLKVIDFDLVHFSVHDTKDYYFYDCQQYDITSKQVVLDHLNALNNILDSKLKYNTITHFDYPYRYTSENIDFKIFEEEYISILKKVKAKNISLEINTAYLKKREEFYEFLIGKFVELGGDNFIIGSDSHDVSTYMNNFDIAIKLLKKYNINKVASYKNQKLEWITI